MEVYVALDYLYHSPDISGYQYSEADIKILPCVGIRYKQKIICATRLVRRSPADNARNQRFFTTRIRVERPKNGLSERVQSRYSR